MSAWYLSKAGFRVTVVDKAGFGSACSHGNCGYVCPSHVLPLCQPGALQKTMRAMLKKNSPFAIKPRLSPAWASWFWKFSRQCNEAAMMSTAAELHGLLQSSKELYQDLITSEGIDCEWEEKGLLLVHDDPEEFEAFAVTDEMLRDQFGVGATAYGKEDVARLEPALNEDAVVGGWHYEGDCHLRPDRLLDALRGLLEQRGVTFVEGRGVTGFARDGDNLRAARFDDGEMEADRVVVAAGAMTPLLSKTLGFRAPIEPGKGYSITTSRPEIAPTHPMIFEETHVAVTPMRSGYRIGSTMEFVGYDTRINPKRLALLEESASKYLKDPIGREVQETWYGWRPMTWDGKPIIGACPGWKNVWIAAGHSMLGMSMATGTGKLVAEMVSGAKPHLPAEPFSARRMLRG